MKRIAFFVSGGGSNMQAVLDALNKGDLSFAPALVIASRPNIYALTRALENGLPSVVVSKKDYASEQAFGAELLKHLKKHSIDLIVLSGYLSLMPKCVVGAYENKIINIHPSLIPAFSGAGMYGTRVYDAVLKSGVEYTGATVHFVDENYDTGKIIFQKPVAIDRQKDTIESLQKKVQTAENEILIRAIKLLT
ncbi:MAG: phosphoribosylglycinamide formyltransferase [Firmicutes bacterium]|nr:phosphoribosylglycinamide formyltransferase [Bacillota bacterium]